MLKEENKGKGFSISFNLPKKTKWKHKQNKQRLMERHQ